MFQPFHSITQRLRLPRLCILCQEYHNQSLALCAPCIDQLPRLDNPCQYCAYPLPEEASPVCGHCIIEKPIFDRACIAYRFEEPLRTLIHDCKYQEKLYLIASLGELIIKAQQGRSDLPELLLPVPMHKKKVQQRGFNQAALLCRYVARRLKIDYELNLIEKIRPTLAQAELNRDQRQKNLDKAFRARPIGARHIALIDDLMTTGSTANELAKTVKRQGPARVEIWCSARAVLQHSG